jgi:hypothetical protein
VRERTRRIAVRAVDRRARARGECAGVVGEAGGCVVGGHEGEDNVLRDDDLALFLTINAVGIRDGADDPEPSAAVMQFQDPYGQLV